YALLPLHQPDVAEHHGIAVALERDRAAAGGLAFLLRPARRAGDLVVLVDQDAVLADRDAGIADLLARGVEAGVLELDIVGLPGERREAHVHVRRLLAIDGAAVALLSIQAEGVQDLDLVAAEDIDPAVPARLPPRRRLEGRPEFGV